MPENLGGVTAAALGAFGAALLITNLISSTGYTGNNAGGTAITLPPTASPPTLPKSTVTRTTVTTTPGAKKDVPVTTVPAVTTVKPPVVVTLQQRITTTQPSGSTTAIQYSVKSRYFPINDRDVLIIIACIIGGFIVISAIVAVVVYRWRQNRNYGQNYGVRPPSSASGALPPQIQENEYYSSSGTSSASPTDIYFDAMKQIPLHRPPDAFMTYSEFGDDEFGLGPHGGVMMGPPPPIMPYHASTMGAYHHKQPPPMMMMEPPATFEYPQQPAPPYPGPYFLNPPPRY